MRSITEDKGGQQMIISLLFLFMTISIAIAMIPALKSVLNIAKQSDNLNCAGFVYVGSGTNLSYNSSLETETTACLAINLYLPYILLIVLIGGVTKLLYDKSSGGGQQYAGY